MLEMHRISGTGPKYSEIGGRIIYAVTDLREWAERGARRATSDPGTTTTLPAKSVDKVSQFEPVGDGATGVERDAAGQPAILSTPAAARLLGVSSFYAIGDLKEWAKRGAKHSTSDPGKTTVLGAIPANRRAIKLAGSVR